MTEEEKFEHVRYLDEDIVHEICHKLAEDIFENKEPLGTFSDHDGSKLESCLALPRQKAYEHELYPTLFHKAAILYYSLNRNHPFGNGNKRISAASLVVFLFINDVRLEVSRKDFFEKTLWVAETTEGVDAVKENLVTWLSENTIPRSGVSADENDLTEVPENSL